MDKIIIGFLQVSLMVSLSVMILGVIGGFVFMFWGHIEECKSADKIKELQKEIDNYKRRG